MKLVFFDSKIVGYQTDKYYFFENEKFYLTAIKAGVITESEKKKAIMLYIAEDAFDEIEQLNNETEQQVQTVRRENAEQEGR